MACWQGNKWYRISSNFSLIIAMFSSLKLEIETVNPWDIPQYHTSSCQRLLFHKHFAKPLTWHQGLTITHRGIHPIFSGPWFGTQINTIILTLHTKWYISQFQCEIPDILRGISETNYSRSAHLSSVTRKRVGSRGLRLSICSAHDYIRQDELCSEGKAISFF